MATPDDRWNLDRIVAEHSDRADLIDHIRSQATILCDIAHQLDEKAASVLVPSFLLSNDALVLDQPIPLAALIDGLAEDHVPGHTQQLLDLRAAVPEYTPEGRRERHRIPTGTKEDVS
ncbi:MAG: hypothetical protein L0I76_04445 [Pseudonocardia sp.]|nr:hypothetical protein [Pseudonocardia sp.]